MFDRSRKKAKCGNFCQIHVGKVPTKWLCARSRNTSCWQCWINEGNSPDRLLFLKLKLRIPILVMFVVDVLVEQSGIAPFSLFLEISNSSNDLILQKEEGMVPDMELSNKTSFIRFGVPKSSGSGPYSLFLLRSKSLRLIGSLGIVPLNWLEPRSIAVAPINSIVDGREPLILLCPIFRVYNVEAVIQNQSGTVSDMLVFEISRLSRLVSHRSHCGNLGPRRHDRSSIFVRLEGGTHVEFTVRVKELSESHNHSKLSSPDKWPSCMKPSKLL